MKCEYCQGEFESKRSTAKYCSSKCRLYALRGVSVTKGLVSVTKLALQKPVSVTEEPLSVTVSVTPKVVSVTEKPVSVTVSVTPEPLSVTDVRDNVSNQPVSVTDVSRVPCKECLKKDIYIAGLEAQLADALADLAYIRDQQRGKPYKKAKSNGDGHLRFSKSRQVKGYGA